MGKCTPHKKTKELISSLRVLLLNQNLPHRQSHHVLGYVYHVMYGATICTPYACKHVIYLTCSQALLARELRVCLGAHVKAFCLCGTIIDVPVLLISCQQPSSRIVRCLCMSSLATCLPAARPPPGCVLDALRSDTYLTPTIEIGQIRQLSSVLNPVAAQEKYQIPSRKGFRGACAELARHERFLPQEV